MGNAFSLNTDISVPSVFQQKYIPSLNGLRALAIIMVIFGHIKYGLNAPSFLYTFNKYIDLGSFGVQIFFVISGFLITGLLLKEKIETGRIDLKKFYLRRAIRILPVFFIYLITITLLKCLQIATVDNRAIIAAALFVTNFGNFHGQWLIAHSWSLAVEQQFYLCWPVIFIFLPRKYIFVFLAIFIYYLFYYYLRYYPLAYLFRGFFISAPPIILGALLSIALFKNWLLKSHHILMHPLCAFSLFYAANVYIPRATQFMPFIYLPLDYLSSSFFIAVFVYYAIHCSKENPVYKFLNFTIITYIGILSYSIYIWQQPFFSSLNSYQVYPFWARFPLNIVLTIIMAFISYHIIEKPLLTLKRHFKQT